MTINNNKIFFRMLAAILIPLGISSCNKSFLDIPSTSSVDAANALTDITGLQTALNGVYDILQGSDYYDRTFTLLPDLMSDNVYISTKNSGRYLHYDDYNVTKMDGNAEGLWDDAYRVIVNCNLIIKAGPAVNGDKDDEQAVEGQAYALRALGYFDLCRAFAQPYNFKADAGQPGVPLITNSSISLGARVEDPSRSTVKEVYDTIISNFKTAIDLLPAKLPGQSSSFRGMITQNAAKALLSKVYLYKGDWKDCETMATDVIKSGQYSLLSTADLVSGFMEADNSETIFEVVNTVSDNAGTNSIGALYGQSNSYGDALPTYNLYNIYSPTDVRRNFMEIGDRNASGAEKNVPLVLKYGTDPTDAENIKVIRLAEVYLNRAEAEAHLGEDAAAIADLATIAKRGDPDVVIDPSLTGQALIDRILLERRKELAFEGDRLFDLTRNKMSFIKYQTGNNSLQVDYPGNLTILPIPQSEIDVNPNLAQNPGYE